MLYIVIVLAAFAPAVILLWYIYKKGRLQQKPVKWFAKAFLYGAFSMILSICISLPICSVVGVNPESPQIQNIQDVMVNSFIIASIPEEMSKLIMLWLFVRKDPNFDKTNDGVWCATCIGLGFAGFENILYLFNGMGNGSWMWISILRAVMSVPGHYFFAVLMGYYYSACHWKLDCRITTKAKVLLVPIAVHGVYNTLLLSMQVNTWFVFLNLVLFFLFFRELWKKTMEKITILEVQ